MSQSVQLSVNTNTNTGPKSTVEAIFTIGKTAPIIIIAMCLLVSLRHCEEHKSNFLAGNLFCLLMAFSNSKVFIRGK